MLEENYEQGIVSFNKVINLDLELDYEVVLRLDESEALKRKLILDHLHDIVDRTSF